MFVTVDLRPDGPLYQKFTIDDLKAQDVPEDAIAAALRADAVARLMLGIEGYRQRLSGVEAGLARPGPERIGIWNAKARIARAHLADPGSMPDVKPGFFKSRLTREAAAKGRALAEQLARIVAKADTFEGLGMLIDAMEAEAEAGLAIVTDDDGLKGGFDAYLAAAKIEAEAAFADALTALNS